MPYLPYSDLDEQKKKAEQGGEVNISGTSTSLNQGAQNAAAPKPVTSSGSWTNLNQYLDANKEQASQMGSEIARTVETAASGAQNKINSLASEKQNLSAVDPNNYLADPTKNTDGDIQTYQKLKGTGGYEGPNDISGTANYADALKNTQDAYQKVQNAGSEEGRIQLLQDQYKRPTYTRGAQVLDNSLLQGNAESKQNLNAINQKYSGLNALLDSTVTDVGNSINTAKQQALTNKKSIQDAEGSAWTSLLNPIQDRASAQNVANRELISRITADAKDESLSDESLKLMGVDVGQRIYDLNLANYLKADSSLVGVNNAANADERSRYLALQRLIQDPSRTEITADGKAINPLFFDKARFDKENAAKAQDMANIFANTSFGGDYQFNHQGGVIKGHADTNVANYLANGASAAQATSTFGGGGGGAFFDWNTLSPTEQGFADGKSGASAASLANLEAFLNDQKYYRTIKKG